LKHLLALSSLGLIALVAACGSSGTDGANTDGSGVDASGATTGSGVGGSSADDPNVVLGAKSDPSGGGSMTSSGGLGQGGSGTGTGTGTGSQSGPVSSVTPITQAMACVSHTAQAQLGALDMFIMLDKSKSMDDQTSTGDSKWALISEAIDAFVADPESAGIGAGIQFFGLFDAKRNTDCNAADYAKPAVPIAALNGNAAKISAAIAAVTSRGGGTPTTPALTGAIDYAASWATAHPTRKTIVLFATDGLPNGCNSTVDSAAAAAKAGLTGKPAIQTYVIGVFGASDKASIPNLNSFAKAGGTGSAFIVDTTGDAEKQFLDAMNAIREANRVGCEFAIPAPKAGEAIDYGRVAVDYTPGGGKLQSLAWVSAAKACSTKGGWYYDDNAAPTKISLCADTCSAVQADTQAKLDIYLACSDEPPGGSGSGGSGSGSGGSSSGSGGASSGGTGSGSGGSSSPACLLSGQSCEANGDCCSGECSGVCLSKVK
jgi:uncharacterized membrane protein YgcG